MLSTALRVVLLACVALSHAAPAAQQQFPFLQTPDPHDPKAPFNPLERKSGSALGAHMSGICPYHDAPGASTVPPQGCLVSAAAFLYRHSSIYANDDEWDDYMKPLVEKLEAHKETFASRENSLTFLKDWECPITEELLEELTEPGIQDAKTMGETMRNLYGPLLPSKKLGKKKPDNKKKPGKIPPFRVFTASSPRDIGSAKAWIRGAFAKWQEGEDGEGDQKVVQLVKVPNKDPNWAVSLTPHKICDGFSKENGKPEMQTWLENFGPAPLARLRRLAPEVGFELNDVIGMFMLCGYESVILPARKSDFCSLDYFHQQDYKNFGFWNDIKYHYQVGYGAKTSPVLGVGWLNTSTHNLVSAYKKKAHPHFKGDGLPPPSAPPNEEHTQLFFPYFTHRQEPPLVLTALGLWNTTEIGVFPDPNRRWKTSHVLPFLGHIALERLSCKNDEDHIRVVVNGAAQKLDSCQDGPGNSCRMDKFQDFVKERVKLYGNFEKGCAKQ